VSTALLVAAIAGCALVARYPARGV
jgi:hypothetical protein